MPIAPETATTPLRSSRASGSSGTSDQLLAQAADGLGGSAERGSTSFAGAQASFSTETASPPDSQFGLAGADFSIDGLEEMEIYGSGFSGTGRCAFLRVGKGCYMAAALAAALCLVGGVALGQTKNAQEAFGQLTGHGGGGNSSHHHGGDHGDHGDSPSPSPSPSPAQTLCTQGLTIKYSDRTAANPCPANSPVGQVCYYLCGHGYSQSRAHICEEDGTFRGGGCTLAGCQPKAEVPNTVSDCDSLGAYGDTCHIGCKAGYTDTEGQPAQVFTYTCAVGGQWQGQELTCQDIDECASNDSVCPEGKTCINTLGNYECSDCTGGKIDDGHGGCKDPPATTCTKGATTIAHSSRKSTPCTGVPGSTCYYQCDAGYSPSSTPHRCDASGTWSGGECTANPCTKGTSIEHSNRNAEISSNLCTGNTGDECDYKCDQGFIPSGDHVCGTDGTFAGGSCQEGHCSRKAFSGSSHLHALTGLCPPHDGQNAALGATCNVTCDSGFSTHGSGQYLCSGSSWSAVDDEATTCEDIDECAASNSPCHASHQHCSNTVGGFKCGDCEEGYHRTLVSDCVGNACHAYRIPHQRASSPECTGTTGSVCAYTCESGYESHGHLTCQPDGTWSGGTCAPRGCTAGTTVAHSNRLPSNPCVGGTGTTCSYECDDGYTRSGTHVCLASGTFSGGSCTQLTCSVGPDAFPNIDNIDVTYSHAHSAGHRQVAQVRCSAGWKPTLAGMDAGQAYSFSCDAQGKWSPDHLGLMMQTNGVLCAAIDCGDPSVPHGTSLMPSGTKYRPPPHETVVTVLCDDNYSLRSGDKTRTCQADGHWSGVAPICQRDTTCPRPAVPTHGRVVYTPGSTSALYQCDPTYVLHPPTETRRCTRGLVGAAPTDFPIFLDF